MKTFNNQLILILCILVLGCDPAQKVTVSTKDLPASVLQPFGRYDYKKEQGLELISSGVHFGFSFEGTQSTLYASIGDPAGHGYLQYEVDGVYQKRIKVEGTASQPFLITAGKGGKHTIWVYKATEAHTGPIFIQKITGASVAPLPIPARPLIEFIGNSITCGAAADPSEVPCGTGQYHDQHNAYYAYGPRVARALGTDFILSSVSGIGMYRNWNSDGPTMPQVYEKNDFQDRSTRIWDFKPYNPSVVSIALGTNDFSNGDGKRVRLPFDSAAFVRHYILFVQQVKGHYPSAQIALLSSPMLNGGTRTLLQNCLAAVKQNVDSLYPSAPPVGLYFFKPMEPHGCSYHPSVEDHGVMAEGLVPFFRKLLQ